MLNVIKKAIEKEMMEYAIELKNQLQAEYLKKFELEFNKHTNKVVLDAISNLKLEMKDNPEHMTTNIHIKM